MTAFAFDPDCPFCKRVAAGDFAVEWATVVGFEPLNPVTPGHFLIVPKAHVRNAAHDPEMAAAVMRDAALYGRQFNSFNLITSVGPAATQTVAHLHLHVVPRREGDGLPLPWTPQQRAAG